MAWAWLYKDHDLLGRCWRWLPAALWVVVFACLAVEITVRSDLVWRLAADPAGVPQVLAVDQERGHFEASREQLHAEVMSVYYQGGSLVDRIWHERERQHVDDVKQVLDLIRWVGLGAGALMLLLSILRWERFWWLRRSGLLLGGLLVGTGILCLQWTVFSRVLHPLVFPQGNWDFLRGYHVIIDLYPQALLGAYLATIIVLFAASGLLAWVVGRLVIRERRPGCWLRSRRQWWLLALTVIGAYPAWMMGGLMFAPWDPGYWSYYALSGLLVVAVIWALASQNRSWPVLSALAVAMLWSIQIAGVHSQARAAAATVSDDGVRLQAAIEAMLADTGRPPEQLDELVPTYLEAVPAPRGASGGWYYVPQPRRVAVDDGGGRRSFRTVWQWTLGFRGPMGFHHEYTSRRGSWNVLTWYGIF